MQNQKGKQQIIYGRNAVTEAIQNGTQLDKVVFQRGIRGEFEKEVRSLCRTHSIPLSVVPKEKLNKFSTGNHQGIVAIISLISYYKIEDVLPMVYEQSGTPLFMILDGVTDVRNFGAIARSAEAFGAHALIIPDKGAALINAEAIKTSAGALLSIPVCRVSSLVNAIDYLKLSGLSVLASDLAADKKLKEFDLKGPWALIVGSEGEGISPSIRSKADELFIIPQSGKIDSLNVSVAAGIMLYEVSSNR